MSTSTGDWQIRHAEVVMRACHEALVSRDSNRRLLAVILLRDYDERYGLLPREVEHVNPGA